MPTTLTHADLVRRAERWLRNTMKCGVVLTEASGDPMRGEIPDAIGWRLYGRESHLVECKVSRSDFLRDAKKVHRIASLGSGRFRWFMVPAGIAKPEDLPVWWGLLEVRGDRVIKVVLPSDNDNALVSDRDSRLRCEVGILCSELRKVQIVQSGGSLLPSASARRIADYVST